MLHFTQTVACLAAVVALTGCGKQASQNSGDARTPPAQHDHDQAHHDDAHDGDGHGHGVERSLGSVTAGGSTFDVTLLSGVEPGSEIHLDIVKTDGPFPIALRLWVGEASGVGSLKSRADGHGDHYHGHVEVPSPLPTGAALWIEVEPASGERTSASLPLP